jgi:PEP-CTERM motif
MSRRVFAASLDLAAMLMSSHAFAIVIMQTLGGPNISIAAFNGQSFTTPSSGGPWDDITFNFFSNVPPTTPEAAGTAFLLNQEYLGRPSNLSSSTTGFLGESTGITGGMYIFPTSLTMDPGVQYFVYDNSSFSLTCDNVVSGGQEYNSSSASGDFAGAGISDNFTLSESVVSAAVPEPSALMVLAAALLSFGLLRRYRKNSRRKDHLTSPGIAAWPFDELGTTCHRWNDVVRRADTTPRRA